MLRSLYEAGPPLVLSTGTSAKPDAGDSRRSRVRVVCMVLAVSCPNVSSAVHFLLCGAYSHYEVGPALNQKETELVPVWCVNISCVEPISPHESHSQSKDRLFWSMDEQFHLAVG